MYDFLLCPDAHLKIAAIGGGVAAKVGREMLLDFLRPSGIGSGAADWGSFSGPPHLPLRAVTAYRAVLQSLGLWGIVGEKIEVQFIKPDGSVETVEAETGESVMQAAVFNDIEGVEAECGGSCMCATCHVYFEEAVLALLPPAAEDETEMLEDVAAERRATSRLSCQIKLTPEMNGIRVHIPDCQY